MFCRVVVCAYFCTLKQTNTHTKIMKRILLLTLLLLSFSTSYAGHWEEIIMDTSTGNCDDRSLESRPRVWFNPAAALIDVRMTSNSSCTMSITNRDGMELYQTTLFTDGSKHSYPLFLDAESGIETYYITISSQNGSYSGAFAL